MTASNIIAGFKACGVCPQDTSVFEVKANEGEHSFSSDCSMSYVPLLTPMKKKAVQSASVDLSESDILEDNTVNSYPRESSLAKFLQVPPKPSTSLLPKLPSFKVLNI